MLENTGDLCPARNQAPTIQYAVSPYTN
jgi:hypothetical protein